MCVEKDVDHGALVARSSFGLALHTIAAREVRIPFDLRILRILLPASEHVSLQKPFSNLTLALTSNDLDLSDTMTISQHNADLRRSGALPCEFADVVDNSLGVGLEPGGNGARVRDGRSTDTLSFTVKTTHDCGCLMLLSERQ
jgi:hypothetical protein